MTTLEKLLSTRGKPLKNKKELETFLQSIISKEGVVLSETYNKKVSKTKKLTLDRIKLLSIQSAIKSLFEEIEKEYSSRGTIYNSVFDEPSTKIKLKDKSELEKAFKPLTELNKYLIDKKIIKKGNTINSKIALKRMLVKAYDTDLISIIKKAKSPTPTPTTTPTPTPVTATDPILEAVDKVSIAYKGLSDVIAKGEKELKIYEEGIQSAIFSIDDEIKGIDISKISDKIGETDIEKEMIKYYGELSTKIKDISTKVEEVYQSKNKRFKMYAEKNEILEKNIKEIKNLFKEKGIGF